MKKLIALFLVASMLIVGAVGCSGGKTTGGSGGGTDTSTATDKSTE